METQKNENNIVLELKHLLGRMMVQVDYMYRNDREMSRLDLDIMMERTRDLYELLCDYQARSVTKEIIEKERTNTEINEGGELINRDVELEIEKPEMTQEPVVNGENDGDEKDISFDEEVENTEEETVETEEETVAVDEKLEDDSEVTKHVLEVDEDDLDEEDWEDESDEMFHVEPVEEKPIEEKPVNEDNSLAARLQRTPVSDIRLAMGINDKMMIVKDLFKGSVERYNKSIDALNDFATLSGARVYMSELQIELQWDTESQAYKMLNDIVERRFI